MPSPVEYRAVLQRKGEGPTSVIVIADGPEDAREKAEDLVRTLNCGLEVVSVQLEDEAGQPGRD